MLGVPKEATVREISHILRPFDGFKNARLVGKEGRAQLGSLPSPLLVPATFSALEVSTQR